MKELVSVIVTTYKRPVTLGRAIDSVLRQSYKNIEVIVVDDNDDGTEYRKMTKNFMKKYINNSKVKYICHTKNMNGAAARNTGIRACNGKFVTFLDDDDEFLEDKIKKQVSKLENMSDEYGAIYSGYKVIRKNRTIKKEIARKQGTLRTELLKMDWGFGSGSNPMFKRCVFDKIGLFDTTFRRHQDWEFMLRFFEKFKICALEDILLKVYSDSRINVPNPQSIVEIKEHYLSKFKKYISSLEEVDRNVIYKNHWMVTAKCFLMKNDYSNFKYYYKKANSFYKITILENIKILIKVAILKIPYIVDLIDIISSTKIKVFDYLQKENRNPESSYE